MISTRILRSEDASLGTMGIIQNTVFGSKEQRYFELKPILWREQMLIVKFLMWT